MWFFYLMWSTLLLWIRKLDASCPQKSCPDILLHRKWAVLDIYINPQWSVTNLPFNKICHSQTSPQENKLSSKWCRLCRVDTSHAESTIPDICVNRLQSHWGGVCRELWCNRAGNEHNNGQGKASSSTWCHCSRVYGANYPAQPRPWVHCNT